MLSKSSLLLMKFRTCSFCLPVFLLFALSALVQAQTVLDGVYSKSQAQRGANHYNTICADCHEGGEPDALPLFGPDFVDRWREAPLSFLHDFISANMPADDAGNLPAASYLETVAFLLQENGFPVGNSNLAVDGLSEILLVGSNGPQPLPASALVKVIGCLQIAGDSVQLVQSSSLIRVRTADETTTEELAQAAAVPRTTGQYILLNTNKLAQETLLGQLVQAKGVLKVQTADTATINVLSLAGTGAPCE